jgi:hypothetical protein
MNLRAMIVTVVTQVPNLATHPSLANGSRRPAFGETAARDQLV